MRYVLGLMCVLTLGMALVACGSKGDGCGEPLDVAGDWEMFSAVERDDCGGREDRLFRMTITQDGNAVTGATAELGTFNGTICGDQMQLDGSFSEDDGTVTVKAKLVVSADGTAMEGTDRWTWTDGVVSCTGSDSLIAVRAGVCADMVCPCTEAGVRGAVAEGGGPFTFDCDVPTTVSTKATIVIEESVILDGEGELTVDGNGGHQVFAIEETATAELRGFVITNGSAIEGGGIDNRGDLSLEDCTVRGNTAEVSAGIRNEGTLNVVNSTVSGNRNTGATNGAGIYNGNSANATVTNSTVSDNTGEGIRNEGTLNLANSTVSGNRDGGIVNDPDATGSTVMTSRNTLVDDGCDNQGDTVSLGYNIESRGDSCGFDPNKGDLVDVSPQELNLGELADNGGPTQTHALGTGSVAIDMIPEAECLDADGEPLTTDQRGLPRDSMCDVGAFEVQP